MFKLTVTKDDAIVMTVANIKNKERIAKVMALAVRDYGKSITYNLEEQK